MIPNVKSRVIVTPPVGFLTLNQVVNKRRLLISTEGLPDSGKTEFLCSCPEPVLITCIDRGIDGVARNPNPPASRNKNVFVTIIKVKFEVTQATQPEYLTDFQTVKTSLYDSLANKDAATAAMDTDSDFWRLQRLASFGKLSKIMPIQYEEVNAARRAIYARAWDANKIVVGTNKLKEEYGIVKDSSGAPVMKDGREVREKTGGFRSDGFDDDNYLWQVRIRHIYKPAGEKEDAKWGLKILRCKHDKSVEGLTLWGRDCNFEGLVSTIFPEVPVGDWGL